ncbi:MAG TPA: hypothetical protein VKX25_05105 [Bryobacteraceae bacterium]|jgi:hypothetical protein|nr:hypothetical protein [Bryobacteraceae bacterium]
MAFNELQVGDQVIRYDRTRTQCVYSSLEKGDADECGCICCQNFAAQRDSVYPELFKRLLDQLGIDPAKEGEVYEMGPTDEGKYMYGGWFYFAGEMIAAGEKTSHSEALEYWFTANCPEAPAFRGGPLLALEFVTALNWVLPVHPE